MSLHSSPRGQSGSSSQATEPANHPAAPITAPTPMTVVTNPKFAVPFWLRRSPTIQVVPPPTNSTVPMAAKVLGPGYGRAQPTAKQPTSAMTIAARQAFREWFTPPKIADIAGLVHYHDCGTRSNRGMRMKEECDPSPRPE